VKLETDSKDIKKQLADDKQQAQALIKLKSAKLAVDAIKIKMEKMEQELGINNSNTIQTLIILPSLTDEAICIV
jgi:hypothetical protein